MSTVSHSHAAASSAREPAFRYAAFMSQYLRRRLKEIRDAAGLTQTALSVKIGVDASFISHVESGRRQMNTDTLVSWLDSCGASLLITEVPEELREALLGLRPDDVHRVVRFAAGVRNLPELPAGPRHPGDIAVAVVESAAAAPVAPKPGRKA